MSPIKRVSLIKLTKNLGKSQKRPASTKSDQPFKIPKKASTEEKPIWVRLKEILENGTIITPENGAAVSELLEAEGPLVIRMAKEMLLAIADSNDISYPHISDCCQRLAQKENWYVHFSFSFSGRLWALLFLFLALGTTPCLANLYYMCGSGRGGIPIEVPKSVTCDISFSGQTEQENILGEVWVPRDDPIRAPAARCSLHTRTVATYHSFWGTKTTSEIENTEKFVEPSICFQAWHLKEYNGQLLQEIQHGVWSTSNKLKLEFKYCCHENLFTVTNFVLEIGTIATMNGEHLMSDLEDVSFCPPSLGTCVLPTSTVVWNATALEPCCMLIQKGLYNMTINEKYVVISALQAAVMLSDLEYVCSKICRNMSSQH